MNPDDINDPGDIPIPEPPPGLTDYELQLYRHAQDVQRTYRLATELVRRWQAGDEPFLSGSKVCKASMNGA